MRWHFVHDAIAGTLPTKRKTTKRRSAIAGTLWHGSLVCAMARLSHKRGELGPFTLGQSWPDMLDRLKCVASVCCWHRLHCQIA